MPVLSQRGTDQLHASAQPQPTAVTPRAEYRIALAALLACVCVVFWQHIFTTDVLYFRDVAAIHFPRLVELRHLVRAGHLPLWNPYEHLGEPVAANPNYLLFYPTTWLAWVLPAAYAFKLHFVLHFLMAAAGSFLLARQQGISPAGCFIAGALFVFSGPVMSLNSANFVAAVPWLPVILVIAGKGLRTGGGKPVIQVAVCFALQFMAGEPLTSLATALLTLAWIFTVRALPGSLAAPGRLVLFGRFVAAGLLAIGFSAVQLFPAVAHLGHAQRAGMEFGNAFIWSLHPLKLLEILFPNFLGDPLNPGANPWVMLDAREPLLLSLFIGIVPLALAFAAVYLCRGRLTRFWAIVAAVCLVIALGRYTPAAYVFYNVVPIFRLVRFPLKFMLPLALAVAQLAAFGVHVLITEPGTPRAARLRRLGCLFAILAALAAVAAASMPLAHPWFARLSNFEFGPGSGSPVPASFNVPVYEVVRLATESLAAAAPAAAFRALLVLAALAGVFLWGARDSRRTVLRVGVAALCLFAIADLSASHRHLNQLVPASFYAGRPAAVRLLQTFSPPGPGAGPALRIFSETMVELPGLPVAEATYSGKLELPPEARLAYAARLSLQTGAGMYGLEDAFPMDIEGALPRRHALVNNLLSYAMIGGEAITPLLRASSVQFALLRRWPAAAGLDYLGSIDNATTQPTRLYAVRDSLPRAYLVSDPADAPSSERGLQTLLSPQFDVRRQVVVNWLPDGLTWDRSAEPGHANLEIREPMHVRIRTQAAASAILVLTDSYDPDWQVTVDGQPRRLLLANEMFRGVIVPAGAHTVEFAYRPAALMAGAGVTLATILFAILLWRRASNAVRPGGDLRSSAI